MSLKLEAVEACVLLPLSLALVLLGRFLRKFCATEGVKGVGEDNGDFGLCICLGAC